MEFPLELGQNILASSTLEDRSDFLKLHKTTVNDVIIRDNRYWVLLGKGNWGACPRREISDVIWDRESYDLYVDRVKDKEYGRRYPNGFWRAEVNDHGSPGEGVAAIYQYRLDIDEFSLKEGRIRRFSPIRSFGSFITIRGDLDPSKYRLHHDPMIAVEDLWGLIQEWLSSNAIVG